MTYDIGTGPYIEALHDLRKHAESMDDTSRNFVLDMCEAARKYHERTRISPDQRKWIVSLTEEFLSQGRADVLTGQLRIEGI